MQEIVKMVAEKTGISEDQAKLAVETVLSFVRSKLPAPLASQLDGFLGGGGASAGLGDLAKNLGGLFPK